MLREWKCTGTMSIVASICTRFAHCPIKRSAAGSSSAVLIETAREKGARMHIAEQNRKSGTDLSPLVSAPSRLTAY